MKLPNINCPRCNHPQKFGQRQRTLPDGDIEVYVQCKMCRWKKVVIVDSCDMISNHKQIQKLRVRAEKDPSLKRVLRKKIAKSKSLVERKFNS